MFGGGPGATTRRVGDPDSGGGSGGGGGGGGAGAGAGAMATRLTQRELGALTEVSAASLFAASIQQQNWHTAMQVLRRFPRAAEECVVDDARRTPIHLAVLLPQHAPQLAHARLEFLRELLGHASMELLLREDADGCSALALAMQTMDDTCEVSKSVVRAIAMQGVSPPAGCPEPATRLAQEAFSNWRETLNNLLGAAEQGDVDYMRRITRGKEAEDFNYDSVDPEGLTSLHMAAMHWQAGAVRILLEAGADPKFADSGGHTAMHHLCNTFEQRRVDPSVLRQKTEKDREACAEALLGFGADISHPDRDGRPALFYACQNGLEGMIRGLVLNGAQINGDCNGGSSFLSLIKDPALQAVAQGHVDKAAAEKASEAEATAQQQPPSGGAGLHTFAAEDMDDDIDFMEAHGDAMGMFSAFGGGHRGRRLGREMKVVPFSAAPAPGADSGVPEHQEIESSSDEEDLPVRPIGTGAVKWGRDSDEGSEASTPGLTEEELAEMGMDDIDDDVSEVSYSSEVEYEIDSDEDCHFAASDSADDDDDFGEEDPNEVYTATLLRHTVGRRTIREYGFKPLHAETLWKMRDRGLRDVMAEFGVPRSAAATVMKKFSWDMAEARRSFRKAGEMPDEFLKLSGIDYDVSETVVRTDGSSIFCPVSMEDSTQWSALGFCMCKFSNEAWTGYFESHIESADVVGLKCMAEKCNVLVPEEFVEALASPSHQTRYRRFLAESYVKDQTSKNTVKFCPAPDCGHAMDARKATVDYENTAVTVRCICNYEFCYRCQTESHAPASCEEISEWNKRFTDDVETQQYLNTFCKPCPTKEMVAEFCKAHPKFRFHTTGEHTRQHGCGRMIYKDKGCNHMWACPCGFHWCWQCGGPY